MRMVSSKGDGTLLPSPSNRKQKNAQSFRASKQPVHRVPTVGTQRTPARPPRPILPPPAIPPECRLPEPETFTLQLIRPAVDLPDLSGGRRVSMIRSFDAPPPGCAPEHVFTVRLETGAPYELHFNGSLLNEFEGEGWQDRPRSALTIRATRSAGLVREIWIEKAMPGRNAHPILLVPVSALHAVSMELDGRELVNMPAR